MVMQPDFIFGEKYNNNTHGDNNSQSSSFTEIVMFLCLISAFTNAFSMIILYDLKGKVNTTIALEYFYIGQALFNSLAMTFQQNNFELIHVDFTFLLCIVGLVFFAYLVQCLNTRAMLLKKPSYIMPFGYITLVVSALIDSFVFGSQFGIIMMIGMLLTSSGLLVKVLVPQQEQEEVTKEIMNQK